MYISPEHRTGYFVKGKAARMDFKKEFLQLPQILQFTASGCIIRNREIAIEYARMRK